MNLQVQWILVQGLFLPLVLWLDDLRVTGNYWGLVVFILLEVLYLVDSVLFIKIFKKEKEMEHEKHKGKHMMSEKDMKKMGGKKMPMKKMPKSKVKMYRE